MKKLFAIAVYSLFLIAPAISQPLNRIVNDEVTGNEILLGYGNRDGMLLHPFSIWFSVEYDNYEVEREVIRKIDPASLDDLTITILLGTWCSDSRREVPRFFRILDEMGLNESRLALIFLDREKAAPGIDTHAYQLEYVPTFVFFRGDEEIGRIVETPLKSLEEDMYAILTGE